MTLSRTVLGVALAVAVAAPQAGAVVLVAREPGGFAVLGEAGRWAELLGNSLALAAGAVAVAVPAGVFAAVVLERGRVRVASGVRGAAAVGLFIPLPVYAAGWQAVLGGGCLSAGPTAEAGAWRPWREGLLPAAWVHGVAGIPWVMWAVAVALRPADRGLEDDARLTGGPAAVVRRVVWPRAAVAAVLAGGWVAVQAFVEVTVTDVMLVRTAAEEAYSQAVGGGIGVAAAVVSGLPLWAGGAAAASWLLARSRNVPLAAGDEVPPWPLGRWPVAATLVWVGTLGLVGLPLVGLVRQAGRAGQGWNVAAFGNRFVGVAGAHGWTLADSLLWATVAGLLTAVIVLAACWQARGSQRFARFVVLLAVAAAVTPTPVVGLGLKQVVAGLVEIEAAALEELGLDSEFPPLRSALYDQPSPLPAVWAAVARFFPLGVVMLWPAVRLVPLELLDATALGGGARVRWRWVVWPHARAAFGRAAAAVGVLALGEVVAGKLVQPPGRQSFAQELFAAMHYGADSTVAAMCLWQIAATAAACGLAAGAGVFRRRARSG